MPADNPNRFVAAWPAGTTARYVALPAPEVGVSLSGPGVTGLTEEAQRLAVQALVWTVTAAVQQAGAPVPVTVASGGPIFETVGTNVFKRPGRRAGVRGGRPDLGGQPVCGPAARHGHYLAFTDDVDGLLGEVMGKASGVCGGKGGSQHLCSDGFYSNGVLGSTVPVATGMALAERERGLGRRDRRLHRRRDARPGRRLREPQHRVALGACRCSSSSRTTTTRSRRRAN